MNISEASLFPGLDGFCHSLKARILFDDLLKRELGAKSFLREDATAHANYSRACKNYVPVFQSKS
jgi:hypothetical protein